MLIVCSFGAGVMVSYIPFNKQRDYHLGTDFLKGAVIALAALFLVGTPMSLVAAGCGLLSATRWFPYPRGHKRKIYGMAAGLLLFMAPDLFLLLLLWCLILGLLQRSFTEQLPASFFLILPLLMFFAKKSDVYILFSTILFVITLLDNFEQLGAGIRLTFEPLVRKIKQRFAAGMPGGSESFGGSSGDFGEGGSIGSGSFSESGGGRFSETSARTGTSGINVNSGAGCDVLSRESNNNMKAAGRQDTRFDTRNPVARPPLWACQVRRMVYVFAILLLVFAFFLNRYVYRGFGLQVESFRKGPPEANVVAITFDDGPDPRFTPAILQILAEEEVKATFFMVGKHVEKHPHLARQVADAGHEIGNHTYSHANLFQTPPGHAAQEIERGEEAIFKATGQRPSLFRPPRGLYEPKLLEETKEKGYTVVLWSLSSKDWLEMRPVDITQTILQNVGPGDILLFHDSGNLIRAEGGERLPTVRSLRAVISGLKEKGYDFVTVTELLILSGLSGDL